MYQQRRQVSNDFKLSFSVNLFGLHLWTKMAFITSSISFNIIEADNLKKYFILLYGDVISGQRRDSY